MRPVALRPRSAGGQRLGNERPAGALTVTLEPLAAEEARHVTLSGWDERLGALAA